MGRGKTFVDFIALLYCILRNTQRKRNPKISLIWFNDYPLEGNRILVF